MSYGCDSISFDAQVNPDDVITDYFVFVFVIAILCTAAAFPSILLGMPALFLAIKVSTVPVYVLQLVFIATWCSSPVLFQVTAIQDCWQLQNVAAVLGDVLLFWTGNCDIGWCHFHHMGVHSVVAPCF